MRKLSLTLALLLALLLAVPASAEGILPVLQTPPPEITETVSYHRMMNFSSTPSASSDSEGRYYYEYSGVTYQQYLDFGRALNQEGFAVSSFSQLDNGTGAAQVSVTKDAATLEIIYNADTQYLKVTYAPRLLAEEVDPDNPYRIAPAQDSILPELEQVISLHAVTGLSRPSPDLVSDGGYRYYYYNVPYAAYARFSVKLAEAGFTLVSSEKTEDGYDRAVVSDGDVTLTLDYSQEGEFAMVTYPLDVSPRNARKYDDYTIVGAGDTVELSENLTANVLGWQAMDQYVTYYYDDNWIPVAKYIDHEHTSGDGVQQMLVTFQITNERPDTLDARSLLNGLTVYCDGESVSCDYGTMSGETHFSTDSDQVLRPKETITFAVGFALRDEQAAHPENVAVTFTDKNYAVRYAYILAP